MSKRAVRMVVHGRVQGVGFRAFVEEEAQRHSLDGWVRNRRDGSVEAVIAGDGVAVEAMIASCRRGPGRVESLDLTAADERALQMRRQGERFSVLMTA